MPTSLYLLFNHQITPDQELDARTSLKVENIITMPPEIQDIWSQVPPDLDGISDVLAPVKSWLSSVSSPGDYVLVQGDFGACFIMVNAAFDLRLIPVYATTKRAVTEELQPDGSLKITRRFKHQRFRKYGD
ncbi:CRISPR-associated protein Csx20 [Desulfobacterales bacterium HSG17]|nr:CRISPR-associated protein Csx20 [Desulfobacterales bacterium HSG17]